MFLCKSLSAIFVIIISINSIIIIFSEPTISFMDKYVFLKQFSRPFSQKPDTQKQRRQI